MSGQLFETTFLHFAAHTLYWIVSFLYIVLVFRLVLKCRYCIWKTVAVWIFLAILLTVLEWGVSGLQNMLYHAHEEFFNRNLVLMNLIVRRHALGGIKRILNSVLLPS